MAVATIVYGPPSGGATIDTDTPAPLGTAAAGTDTAVSAGDHVHDMPALDTLDAPTDITTLNATTSAHGLLLKATAPASGLLSVVGIGNGETVYANKALFDTTNPAALGTAAPGTALVAARRDHVHATPTTFAVLAGTAGGQTLNGGTAASESLVLKGTAHATAGPVTVSGSKFRFGKGADVVAADPLVLGNDGNVFTVTGNTNFGLITSTNFTAGDIIWLIFTGTPTLTDGASPSGDNKAIYNFSTNNIVISSRDCCVMLVYDGTAWHASGGFS